MPLRIPSGNYHSLNSLEYKFIYYHFIVQSEPGPTEEDFEPQDESLTQHPFPPPLYINTKGIHKDMGLSEPPDWGENHTAAAPLQEQVRSYCLKGDLTGGEGGKNTNQEKA